VRESNVETTIEIFGAVKIHSNGSITFTKDYKGGEASTLFWLSLADRHPAVLQQRITELEKQISDQLKVIESYEKLHEGEEQQSSVLINTKVNPSERDKHVVKWGDINWNRGNTFFTDSFNAFNEDSFKASDDTIKFSFELLDPEDEQTAAYERAKKVLQ
jgi:hypothetical protein